MTPRVGQRVRLVTPENGRLHGAVARVVQLTDYGAIVSTPAAATGSFRALWSEMDGAANVGAATSPRISGTTGNACARCGSANMIRVGTCECCQNCGESTGC